MANRNPRHRRTVFFIDPIEASSYPVTETGYALLYRAWVRAQEDGGTVYTVYPDTRVEATTVRGRPAWTVNAHRVEHFSRSPYEHFRSQRDHYDAASDVGSERCHRESAAEPMPLTDADVIIFRQESGAFDDRARLLTTLQTVEDDVLVHLSPRLALDPAFGSKVLPAQIAPDRVPASFDTRGTTEGIEGKIDAALRFVDRTLGAPDTFIAKPARGDNGVGITACGRSPIAGRADVEPRPALEGLLRAHGDLIVQAYVPSVRAPSDVDPRHAPRDRRDFGEIRFLLIDGTIPRTRDGRRIDVARRVPTETSLVADSGISYPTSLSSEECDFLAHVGREYLRRGISFGGGDLIRTPDPDRPFFFTDAARSVCGHAVVTGALNGEPYLIVDQVLDSIERQVIRRRVEAFEPRVALPA